MKKIILLLMCILLLFAAGCLSAAENPDAALETLDDPKDFETETIDEQEISPYHNLTVRSDPSFSLIYLNGEYTGQVTPYTFENLETGIYTVRVTDIMNNSRENTFELTKSGKVSFDIPMGFNKYGEILSDADLSKTGLVAVYSNPESVVLTINSKKLYRDAIETPYIVGGIKSDTWANVRVTASNTEFAFDRNTYPIISRTVTKASFYQSPEKLQSITFESLAYTGSRYSINGNMNLGTIPETREWAGMHRYYVVKHEGDYISYFPSTAKRSGTKIILEPREYTTHSVHVTSQIPGARIFVDGMDTGFHTPYTIDGLSDGFHKITTSRIGYLPSEKDIQLSGDSSTMNVAMPTTEEYSSSYLLITSAKPGAKIYIHGKDTGERTPAVFPYMPIGTYSIRVTPSVEDTKEITVHPNVVNRVEFT